MQTFYVKLPIEDVQALKALARTLAYRNQVDTTWQALLRQGVRNLLKNEAGGCVGCSR